MDLNKRVDLSISLVRWYNHSDALNSIGKKKSKFLGRKNTFVINFFFVYNFCLFHLSIEIFC